jgi:hypothetical protein
MDVAETDPHRPRAVSEMAGAGDWNRLVSMLERTDPPNVILAGPAGVGKSCALRLALRGSITMWLQCSQDPTLRDNRDRIKAAARRRVSDGIAWIVLENAGLLHTDAQSFLRRIIETSLGSTRFVLEVRDLATVAEPLLSRAVLFNAPQLMEYEIRAEIVHRNPAVPMEVAGQIASQSGANVRWAVLQGLGSSDGMIDDSVPTAADVHTWTDVLAAMEALSTTGSAGRAWLGDTTTTWERAGGACPWALVAHTLAKRVA